MTPGEELEFRVARLYFWTGWFARYSVNLAEQFHPDQLLLTDLDLLAFRYDSLLRRQMIIGESKSGDGKSGPKALDRMFWLAGVARYTGADSAVLTIRRKISGRVRQVAESLDVTLFTVEDLSRREELAGVTKLRRGSLDPELVGQRSELRKRAENFADGGRYLKFLWSELWLLEPWVALKRLVSLLDAASKRWHEQLSTNEEFVLRYVLGEATVDFCYLVLSTAGEVVWLPGSEGTERIIERLSEGLAPTRQLVKLSEGVDRFLAGVLHELNAPAATRAKVQGAFYPRPPGWTEAYIELVTRLIASPAQAADLPRLMDVVIFDAFVKREGVDPAVLERLGTTEPEAVMGLGRLIGAFLTGQVGTPSEVFTALDPAGSRAGTSPDRTRPARLSNVGPLSADGPANAKPPGGEQLPLGDSAQLDRAENSVKPRPN